MISKGSNCAINNDFVKKWALQFHLPHFTVLVLNQSPISAIFAIVWFPFAPKSVPSGDLLYKEVFLNAQSNAQWSLFFNAAAMILQDISPTYCKFTNSSMFWLVAPPTTWGNLFLYYILHRKIVIVAWFAILWYATIIEEKVKKLQLEIALVRNSLPALLLMIANSQNKILSWSTLFFHATKEAWLAVRAEQGRAGQSNCLLLWD